MSTRPHRIVEDKENGGFRVEWGTLVTRGIQIGFLAFLATIGTVSTLSYIVNAQGTKLEQHEGQIKTIEEAASDISHAQDIMRIEQAYAVKQLEAIAKKLDGARARATIPRPPQ